MKIEILNYECTLLQPGFDTLILFNVDSIKPVSESVIENNFKENNNISNELICDDFDIENKSCEFSMGDVLYVYNPKENFLQDCECWLHDLKVNNIKILDGEILLIKYPTLIPYGSVAKYSVIEFMQDSCSDEYGISTIDHQLYERVKSFLIKEKQVYPIYYCNVLTKWGIASSYDSYLGEHDAWEEFVGFVDI